MSKSYDLALTHASTALNLLEGLGFVVNYEKSCLEPSQVTEILGFEINSQILTILLPRDKIRKIRKKCQDLLDNPNTSVRELSKFLGLLTSPTQAIFPAPLHYRNLHAICQEPSVETVRVLRNYCTSQSSGSTRDSMVEGPSNCLEWASHSETVHPTDNRDGCFNQRLGCPLPGYEHGRGGGGR